MAITLEKNQRINLLLDCYENLLTTKQLDYASKYYRDDLSLAEIAEELNISRNAVYDTVKKTAKLLEDYEVKLNLLEKYQERIDIIEKIEKDINKEHKNIDQHLKMLRDL